MRVRSCRAGAYTSGGVTPLILIVLGAAACTHDDPKNSEPTAQPALPASPPPVETAPASSPTAPPHTSASAPPSPTPSVALPSESEAPIVIAFRPNGRAFAWGARTKASLFPIGGGAPVALPDHERGIVALAFSNQGDRLATVEQGGKVRVWDPGAGKLLAELPDAIAGDVQAIAFSPDGKRLAGAGSSTTLWDLDRSVKLCATEDSMAFDLAFTRDQGSIVTTAVGLMVRWNAATCAQQAGGDAATGGTFGSWVSPGAEYVAAAAPDGHGLSLFEGRSFKGIDILAKSAGCQDHIGPVRFSRDGEILLASGSNRWLRSFRLDSKKTIAAYDVPRPDEVSQLVMFDDGERLLIVRGNKGELASAVSKSVAYEIDLKGAYAFDVSWDMKHLLGAGDDAAHVWDTATGKLEASYPLPR